MTEQNNSSSSETALDKTYEALENAWENARDNKDQAGIDAVIVGLKELTEQAHSNSCCLLGIVLDSEVNIQRDEFQAIDYYEQATKLNNGRACYLLACKYSIRNDEENAAKLFLQGAESGYAPCMRAIGIRMMRGNGIEKNGLTGIRWVKKAFDAGGDITAQITYAKELINGNLISTDLPKAIDLLEPVYRNKDESDSHAEVAWQLHRAHTKLGDAASKKKAEEWFRIAADLGHEQAKHRVDDIKQNDQWDTLKNLSVPSLFPFGNKFTFFYKTGKVVDKRTETRSHTTGGGVNGNVIVGTSHTFHQVIELRGQDGDQFTVSPDKPITLSTGSEVFVVYMCKGNSDTGLPTIILDRNNGQTHEVSNPKIIMRRMLLQAVPMTLVIAIVTAYLGSIFKSAIFNSDIVPIICMLYIGYKAIKTFHKAYIRNKLRSAHIQKITNFLKQKS